MAENTPSARHDQVFAIVRVDHFQGDAVAVRDKVTVKKIVWTQERAEAETARLNELVSSKSGIEYFWQTTRLERAK